MRIFHLATAADWRAARATGTYTISTRGRTLAEEGFIHASRGDQWQGVRERYYADLDEPLVLLSIDTDLLQSPVVDEAVPGSDETFPHIFGPIQVAAVTHVLPLEALPGGTPRTPPADAGAGPLEAAPVSDAESFSRLFLGEVFKQLLLASVVLACVVAATLVGQSTGRDWGPLLGALLGLLLGVLAARTLAARRAS